MGMTNAERQARFQHRRAARIKELEARVAELEAEVSRLQAMGPLVTSMVAHGPTVTNAMESHGVVEEIIMEPDGYVMPWQVEA